MEEKSIYNPNKLTCYIGIDNGVSGSIGVIRSDETKMFFPVPTKNILNYQKSDIKHINRIDIVKVVDQLAQITSGTNNYVLIERPMVNPKMFNSTTSALRALEATLIYLEMLGIDNYEYVDSKAWQKHLLPRWTKGDDLKALSREIGTRLFPQFKDLFVKQRDADGMLIAEYCRIYYKMD